LTDVATRSYISVGVMKSVGIRELKNRLSEYLRRVRAGETVLVTDRGQAVAELKAPGKAPMLEHLQPDLAVLAARGGVAIGGRNQPGVYPSLGPLVPEGTTEKLLSEGRGET